VIKEVLTMFSARWKWTNFDGPRFVNDRLFDVLKKGDHRHSKKALRLVKETLALFFDRRRMNAIVLAWKLNLSVIKADMETKRKIFFDCCHALDVGIEMMRLSQQHTVLLNTKENDDMMKPNFTGFFMSLVANYDRITEGFPDTFESVQSIVEVLSCPDKGIMLEVFNEPKMDTIAEVIEVAMVRRTYSFEETEDFHVYHKFTEALDPKTTSEDYQKFKEERDELEKENTQLKEDNVSQTFVLLL
jgi:hypothetical protein